MEETLLIDKFDKTKDVIFQSASTIIYKTMDLNTNKKVLVKHPFKKFPSPSLVENFRKEYQFGKALYELFPENFVNVIELIETSGTVALVQEPEGASLAEIITTKGKFKLEEFLEYSISITDSLAKLHSNNMIHQDIKPANIVLGENGKLKIIDLGITVIVSRKSPSISTNSPVGTFLYMSPEQTGRISKNIDFRSDIYSLGITFYEMLTGFVPFNGDKISLVHSHITKKLPIIENIPNQINDILQKMCSKNQNERYFTSSGLLKDLQFCLENISKINEIQFECGKDELDQFHIPNKLYGRDEELTLLRSFIESNTSNMCCISGYSGCGKSKLISEITKDPKNNVLMAGGKFDQFDRSTPYSAFISICKSMLFQIMEDEEFKTKVTNLLEISLVDEFGSIMNSMIPEIQLFIGEQKSEIPILSKTEEVQKRLFNAFIKFFNCFTQNKQLVLFIDDLQWSDSASFQLIEHILTLKKCKIFIIGAYRDNEIDSNHPLTQILQQNKNIQEINLKPLKIEYLNEMISDTLLLKSEETLSLGELIHKKTLGNPFFSREFLITLYEENLIYFDGKWKWDLQKVQNMNFSSNVIDFMIQNLKKESKEMQKILTCASCLGNTFTVPELSLIWDDKKDLVTLLLEPSRNGWIYQISSQEYKFFHDRLQQASYELFSEEERKKSHLTIGKALLKSSIEKNDLNDKIFKIVNHLNIVKDVYEDKNELLKLNVMAANKCQQNSAIKAAHEYSSIAMNLLSEDHWKNNYDNAFLAYSSHADSCFGVVDHESSTKTFQSILEHVTHRIQKLKTYSNFMKVTLASFQFDLGFDNLLSVLSMFEETKEIPENYQNPDLSNKWLFQLKSNIDDQVDLYGGVSQIFDKMKYCDDEEMILLQKILAETSDLVILCEKATPTFVLTCPLVALYLSLKNGFTENALSGFSFGAVYLSTFFRDPKGREMYFLVEKLKQIMKNYQVSIVEFSQAANCQFAGNVKGNIQHCEAALKYSMSHSEYIYCGYAMFYSCVNSSFSGMHAQTVISKAKNYQSYILATGNMYGHGYFESVINFTEDISGLKAFSPQYKIPNWVTLKGCAPTYDSYKGILEYYACDYDSAMSFFDSAEKRISDVFGFPFYYECQMYQLLTWTEVYSQKKDNELKERIETRLKDFKELGKLGPFYFQPRYEIMCHAYASSKDDSDTISLIKSFEETIKACQKYYLILPSAVAATILLRHLVKKKFPSSVCQMYFNNIVETYDNIQAKGMITYLLKEFPSFSIRRSSSSGLSSTTTISMTTTSTTSLGSNDESLDMMSIIKASQALSVELSLSNLITQVMQIILENVGAERGILMMYSKNELLVKAIADENNVKLSNHSISKSKDEICSSLIDIVRATKKEIILDNAKQSSYSKNSYIEKNETKSVFVHPIIKGNNLMGIIYLENNTIEGTFNMNRKIVLGHISSQLAISYENATLYEDLNLLNKSYERFLPTEFLNQLGKGDVTKIKKGDATTKNMSILFSDIRGFTNLTEKMDSSESFSFVNDILSYLSPIISKNNGFIDKFLGDCIMALFPYKVDDAVKCGLEMVQALNIYNKTKRNGLEAVKMGIGINYGSLMIGTLGAEERLDGTVISDAVNTASRVESLTKTLGANMVVTQEVIDNLHIKFKNFCIGTYLLKGKENPMTLYRIIDSNSKENIDQFNLGLVEFNSQNFKKAKMIFSNLSDSTSKYLFNVCDIYEGHVFPDDWSGVIQIDKDGNPEKSERITITEKKVSLLKKEEKNDLFEYLTASKKDEILSLIASKYSNEINEYLNNKK